MADVVVAVAAAAGICSLAKVVVQSIRQRLKRRRRGRGKPLREVVAACEARWFLQDMQLAMAGDAEAMVRVGHMLMVGYGAKQDPAAAAQWLREAWAITNYKEPARWAVLDPEESAVPRMNQRCRNTDASTAAAAAAAAAAEAQQLPPAAAPPAGGGGDAGDGGGPAGSSGGGGAAGGGQAPAQQQQQQQQQPRQGQQQQPQQAAHGSAGRGHWKCSASSTGGGHTHTSSSSSSQQLQQTYGLAGDGSAGHLLGEKQLTAAPAGCHRSSEQTTAGSCCQGRMGCASGTGARAGATQHTTVISGSERAPGLKQQRRAGQDHDRDQLLKQLAPAQQRHHSLVAVEVLQPGGGTFAVL